MKTEWDYTDLADAYLKRPDYAGEAINQMISKAAVNKGDRVCDVGAGVGHLTIELARRGLDVTAVEPNDAMRANGIERVSTFKNVKWFEGTGENTGQPSGSFRLVTFGSSFNVVNQQAALKETARILQPKGWFACMWNHRDLSDPVQDGIEKIIKGVVENYNYGRRREDQTSAIEQSGLFGEVTAIEHTINHTQSVDECVEAWRSHATLQRQTQEKFPKVVEEIEKYLRKLGKSQVIIPYSTRIWMAQLIAPR